MIGKCLLFFLLATSVQLYASSSQLSPVSKPDIDENKVLDVFSTNGVGQSELIEIERAEADILDTKRKSEYVHIIKIDVDLVSNEIAKAGILRFNLPNGAMIKAFTDSLKRFDIPGDPGYHGWSWQGYIFEGDLKVRDPLKVIRLSIGASVVGSIRYEGKELWIEHLAQNRYYTLSEKIPGSPSLSNSSHLSGVELKKFKEEYKKECERIKVLQKTKISCSEKE